MISHAILLHRPRTVKRGADKNHPTGVLYPGADSIRPSLGCTLPLVILHPVPEMCYTESHIVCAASQFFFLVPMRSARWFALKPMIFPDRSMQINSDQRHLRPAFFRSGDTVSFPPQSQPPARSGVELAGSRPLFPGLPGGKLINGLPIGNFQEKRLLFNQIDKPGQVHVYKMECRAGERLRGQMLAPVLPRGGGIAPAFAIIGQSLPYSADVQRLPVELPQGYSAIVAQPPAQLLQPMQDMLTRFHYYPGPVLDTRTLVGGTCYLVVWSPQNQMGKYMIQTGHRWPLGVTYWASVPFFWWRVRGWFGLDRAGGVAAVVGLVMLGLLVARLLKTRLYPNHVE